MNVSHPLTFHSGRLADQMTPVVIIAGAVFWTKRAEDQELSVAEVFSALAIISLISSPISQLISCLPNAMASIACFDRIQEYLLEEEIESSCLESSGSHDKTGFEEREGGTSRLPWSASIELTGMIPHQSHSPSSPAAVILKDGTYTPADSESPILQGISLTVSRSSCVMIAGPVGSGKTTLLKVILGEKPLSKGSVQVDRNQIAYCNQKPWLRNISVRDNIVGPNLFDDLWFATVVRACALDKDLSLLPNGDQTLVGSGGVALSGGQKQRVVSADGNPNRQPDAQLSRLWLVQCTHTRAFSFSTMS
jgi:ATP-binding cassette, subfamily C (CFTR/MRP), member 1